MSEFCYTCRSRPCECYKPDDAAIQRALSEKPTVYAPSYFDWRATQPKPPAKGIESIWYNGERIWP